MKKKELADLKIKSHEQLKKAVADLEKDKTGLQLELRQGKLKNLHAVKKKKKEIAQALTILRAKVLTEVSTKEAKSGSN